MDDSESRNLRFLENVLAEALRRDVGAVRLSDHPRSIECLANDVAHRVFSAAKAEGLVAIHLDQ